VGDLSGLKVSIEQVGIIQPVIVTEVGDDDYQLLAGERRYTAARELGLDTVPAIVRTIEEQRRLEIQIIENVQRKDLDALEEAESYRRLMDEHNYTQEEVAQKLGKDQSSISRIIRVLDLPEDVRNDYATSHRVSKSLLLEVVRERSEEDQRALWKRIKSGDIRTIDEARLARKEKKGQEPPEENPTPVKFNLRLKEKDVLVSVVFRSGDADENDCLKALQTVARELKKNIIAKPQGQNSSAPEPTEMEEETNQEQDGQ
jgi:ParB family chromosome partitioning protein